LTGRRSEKIPELHIRTFEQKSFYISFSYVKWLGYMKVLAMVMVLCVMAAGIPFQFQEMNSSHQEGHTLEMAVLCDILEMEGEFSLEFNGAKHYDIECSRSDPTLIDFEYLVIDADSIFINDKNTRKDVIMTRPSSDNKTKFRVKNLSQTELKILDEDTVMRRIWIKKIEGCRKDARITFSQDSGELYTIFGKDSIMHLESFCQNSSWTLELSGDFQIQIVDEEENSEPVRNEEYGIGPNLTNAQIVFSGGLSVQNGKAPRVNPFRLNLNFDDDVSSLNLVDGQTTIISETVSDKETSENHFLRVVDDDFRIDMQKDFYHTNDYLKRFQLKNLETMWIDEIRESNEKLLVETRAIYSQDTLFPKIFAVTKYFPASEKKEESGCLVETTNSEITCNEVKFLEGNQYRVEIEIQKLVRESIQIDIEDINCSCFVSYDGEKMLKDINLGDIGFHHTYKFIVVSGCSRLSDSSDCFTKVFYHKKSNEHQGDLPFCETRRFSAIINSGIVLGIDPPESEPREISEDDVLEIEKNISLDSETSNPVIVRAFLVVEKGFEVVGGASYVDGKLSNNGNTLLFRVELKPPDVEKTESPYKVRILVFYKMSGSDYYVLYLPDPAKDETVVIDVVVKPSGSFFYDHPNINTALVSFIAGVIATSFVSITIYFIKNRKMKKKREKRK
jgi:hypothetical protein